MAKTTIPAGYIAANAITSTELAANSVTAAAIASGAILSIDIGANSVSSTAIAANAVDSSEIASNAVGTSQIAGDAVTAAKIADNAVGSDQIAANAVGSSELASGALSGQNFTGDVTFDTNVLFVDSANNRVGVGTISPSTTLSVQGSGANGIELDNDTVTTTSSQRLFFTTTAGSNSMNSESGALTFRTGATAGSASGTERMRIDSSGNVGIGTSSPNSTAGFTTLTLNNATSGGIIDFENNTSLVGRIFNTSTNFHVYNQTANSLLFGTGGSEKMRIDSSGNVGLGVTPSAWNTASYNVMQLGFGASVHGQTDDAATIQVGANFFIASDYAYKYIQSDFASRYAQENGVHSWHTAASGTAGNTISFSEAMRIDSSGRVGIGAISSGPKLLVSANSTSLAANFINSNASGFGANISGGSGTNYSLKVEEYSGNEIFRINGNGNVGIGTIDPNSPLHIQADGIGLRLDGTANTTRTIFFRNTTDANPATIYSDGSFKLYTEDPNTDIRFSAIRDIEYQSTSTNSTAGHHIFKSYNTEIMRIDGANNRVGISQTNPTERLHIGSGQSNYIRIHNAGSGDVASGITITRGNDFGLALYDNPFDDTTTFSASGHINFRTDSTSYRIYIKDNGSVAVGGNAVAGKSFEVQDRQSGYSSFWVDDNNRQYGRGITNAYGLLGGNSTSYDGDGGTFPMYGFGGAADNAAEESVDFWIRSTTSEWQPMVFFCIGASTNTNQTGQTAGWALIRATHYNNTVATSILDSGGGGTFSLSVVSGSLDLNDVMQVRITYNGGQNRANLSVWCNTYYEIRGVQRS